jgi:hypothetical protein
MLTYYKKCIEFAVVLLLTVPAQAEFFPTLLGVGTSNITDTVNIAQRGDSLGLRITGYDNENNHHITLGITSTGLALIESQTANNFKIATSSGSGGISIYGTAYVQLQTAAAQEMYFDAGELFYWRDVDSSNATRMTLNSSNGDLVITGSFTFNEKSSDPSDPSEGTAIIWMSDGNGTGDDGDIMMKITAGGSTKTGTLVDFSSW